MTTNNTLTLQMAVPVLGKYATHASGSEARINICLQKLLEYRARMYHHQFPDRYHIGIIDTA